MPGLSFNSLYEIQPQKSGVKTRGFCPFQFSLWDSFIFDMSIFLIHKYTFNSLYEIPGWPAKTPSLLAKNFQFSLWDSMAQQKIKSWEKAFNSLYEILCRIHQYYCYLAYSFNSLYEIQFTGKTGVYWQNPLSILFMRFCLRKPATIQELIQLFQFSLWDSVLREMVLCCMATFNSLYEIHCIK